MLAFDPSTCETANVLARGRQRRRSQQLASDRRAALLGRKQVRERLGNVACLAHLDEMSHAAIRRSQIQTGAGAGVDK
jgi:hypothetical protein